MLFSESQIIAQKNLLIILALSWRSTYSMHAVTVAVAFAARGTDLLPLHLQKLVNRNIFLVFFIQEGLVQRQNIS